MAGPLVPTVALAETYDRGWDAVQAYRRWATWSDARPETGPDRAATVLGLNQETVRDWRDGVTPRSVTGIETARERGWVHVPPETDLGQGLIGLLAWVASSGSLTDTGVGHTPTFRVDSEAADQRLQYWVRLADVELGAEPIRESDVGRWLRPASHGNILGRVLTVLGVERGGVSTMGWPDAIADRPGTPVEQRFAAIWVRNRGQADGDMVYVTARDAAEPLAAAVDQATKTAVERDGARLILPVAAVRELCGMVRVPPGPERTW